MRDNIELEIKGLKCDNVNCNYEDKSIKRSEYEACINKSCPNCGENLLTFNDYINVLILENAVRETNEMKSGEIGEKEYKTVKVNLHKNITFEL